MPQEAKSGVTPVGRVIWGSVWEKQTEGYQGAKYEAGKEPIQFGFAVRKDDPGVNAFLKLIFDQAIGGYPNNQNLQNRILQEWNSGFANGLFKFKIKDGDKPNDQGVINENARGCWVFTMSTTIPLKYANMQNAEIDPKMIKRGYYVDIFYSVKVNDLTDANAGVYLNPQIVRLVAFGEEIIGGPSIEQAFANHAPTHLPPGASATPIGGGAMPGGPGAGGTMPGNGANAGGMPGSGQNSAPGASPSSGPGATAMPGNGGNMPSPGGPGNLTTSSPSRPRFDPNTGQPIHYPDEVAAAPRFDPNTGQPIQPAAPAMRFDPNTGQPINPNTGQPVAPHTAFVGGPGQG